MEMQPLPLTIDAGSVIRVGGTRVTLDTVIAAFTEGAAPEEIAYQYLSLRLSYIYSVTSYYLQQRADVEAYLAQRDENLNNAILRGLLRRNPDPDIDHALGLRPPDCPSDHRRDPRQQEPADCHE